VRCLAGLVIACATTVAHAQPTQTADDFHRAGEAAYKSGDYAAAASAFEAAYRMNPRPQTLFSLAQAYRQLYVEHHEPGVLLRAVELYRQYLAQAPRGGRSADAHELLANLDPLAQLVSREHPNARATAPAAKTQLLVWSAIEDARARIDDGAPVELPRLVEAVPGPHALVLTAPGHAETTLKITAIENELVPVEGRLPVLPSLLAISADSGASLVIDGMPHARGRDPLQLVPGTHRIWLGARGRTPEVREVTLAPGATRRLDITLSVSPRRVRAKWMYVAGGVLAASGLAALGYAHYRAEGARDLYAERDDRAWTMADYTTYNNDRTVVDRSEVGGTGLLVTSALVSALATWWWFDDTPAP
jgi:tetratricopeptide (TPR) repeat protein